MHEMFIEQGSVGTDEIHYDSSQKFTQRKPHQQLQIRSDELIFIEDIQNQSAQTSPKSHTHVKNKSSGLKSPYPQNSIMSKINIFEPIQEEQAQYYEILKYDESEFKTELKIVQE